PPPPAPFPSTTLFRSRTYLHRALERERLPHAWLLVGPESARPLDFAHELARTLFCQSPPADPLAPWFCGTCAACRAIDHGNHPRSGEHTSELQSRENL